MYLNQTLKQMIIEKCHENVIQQKELAKIAGYNPVGGGFSKWLNEPDRDITDFNGLIGVINKLFPYTESELMSDYAKSLDENRKTARYMLEYASVNNLKDLASYLRSKLTESRNSISKAWGEIYTIDHKAFTNQITLHESISMAAEYIHHEHPEVRAYSRLIQIYGYHDMKINTAVDELMELAEKDIDEIKDTFIRDSYGARLAVIAGHDYLHSGDVKNARLQGKKILLSSSCHNFKTLANLSIGNSYLFESFDKAKKYLKEALELCYLQNDTYYSKQVRSSLNFLHNYWGKPVPYQMVDDSISTSHDKAFQLIKQGDKETALLLLNSINLEECSECEKGFNYFYRGLISNSKEDYYTSIMHFKIIGEKFYRSAALIELQKIGENEVLLRTLSA